MINLGFLSRPQNRVRVRRVGSLVIPAYDSLTGEQIVVGRRDDNSWIKRSDNPSDPSNPDLLTYMYLAQRQAGLPLVSHHVLWSYDDWAAGEFGKGGLGNNLYGSDDDGATWAAITEFSDVVDYGPSTNLVYVLHGGGTILSYRPSGVYASPTGGHDFTLGATMNRVVVQHQIALGGGTTRFYVVLLAADGVYVLVYDQNGPTFTPVSLDGPTAYPTADPIPWAQRFDRVSPGSNSALSSVYLILQPVEYGGIYSIPLSGLTPAGGSWTLDLSSGTTPTLVTATFMAVGGPRSFRWFNWNLSQIWTEMNLAPNPASPSGTRGAFSGAEAIWGGVFPTVETGIPPVGEQFVTIDPFDPHTIISIDESIRTAYIFLGDKAGEGSSPSYTARQLVAVIRRASATIEFHDESFLLTVGGVLYTPQARNTGANVNPSVFDPSWRNVIG